MLIAKLNSSGSIIEYYGGYSSIPSTYPPPSADYEPLYNNEDSSKYFYVLNTNVYNSAILNYNNVRYISILFPNPTNIRGYYDGSAWTSVQAFNNGGNKYSVNSWSRINVGNINIIAADGFTDGSLMDSELPIFTDPQEYMNYITNPYVPPTPPPTTHVSGGGGGFYGGYKGVIN